MSFMWGHHILRILAPLKKRLIFSLGKLNDNGESLNFDFKKINVNEKRKGSGAVNNFLFLPFS
jgi:hypothetical protein